MPERIQRRRAPGWRMPEGAIYVGRPTWWGNPFDFRAAGFCWIALGYGFRGDADGRRAASVAAFRDWLTAPAGKVVVSYDQGVVLEAGGRKVDLGPRATAGRAPTIDEIRAELRGHDLACWCPLTLPDGSRCPCHADVLLELANA